MRNATFCKRFIYLTDHGQGTQTQQNYTRPFTQQTIGMQLYKFCALQKMTHLFGADALAQKRTTQGIGTRGTVICARTSNVLASLTSNKIILKHSALIASMTTKQGGLGIQHPRSTVILSYFLTMRCNIQYATEGIWASNHTQPIVLPEHLRSLHKNWQDSPLPSLTPFGKHYQDFNSICMHQ